ncbi:uncharacterized protein LOC134003641 [Scomber scombrus]|uniref:uncharacterized protein LOC134003641 n=1 Tax=Scomber scombrus TaxID=13677 RepID=UPI002DD7CD61|nr:uncharacterized protein LOC134003641 [Scomber scombrus]
MEAEAAASVLLAFFLLRFPVAVHPSSFGCVTYKHIKICAIKGSSVEFPCSYPRNVEVTHISGWSRKSTKLHPVSKKHPPKKMPAHSFKKKSRSNDCTLKLTDLKQSDASFYFFKYSFRNVAGVNMTCEGAPGVRLLVFASALSIQLEEIVRGQKVPLANQTVIEGQKMMLTCVPTCAGSLNSNPGYICFKNGLQLNGSRTNSSFLSFDPIGNKNTGSYVCAVIGYKDFTSSAVNLRVMRSPRNTVELPENTDGGSKKDGKENLKHSCDANNPTDQNLKNCQMPRDKTVFKFSIILVVSVCVGWAIAIMVAILSFKLKRKKKRRRCVSSVPEPPVHNSDSYMALDITSMTAEYDTLDIVKRCTVSDEGDTIYENLPTTGL